MKLYRKFIRPMHGYPGQHYEPKTEPIEKEEKWYPEEEHEYLEKKYASYNEGSFSDLIFEDKYEPYLPKEQEAVPVIQREVMNMLVWCCGSCGVAITDGDKFCRNCGKKMKWDA